LVLQKLSSILRKAAIMTGFPIFSIGVWNAWIPMLVFFVMTMAPFLLDALRVTSGLTQ